MAVALGQSAQFTGRVTDPSGASVPGVRIVARNLGSGVSNAAVTNVEGYYTVTRLDPGPYQLEAAADGFRTVTRKNLSLQVDQSARVDFALEVGMVAERVEISAAAALVESETSSLGQVINNKSIVEMPLNGRNAWDLSRLSGASTYVRAIGDAGEIPAISMAGGRTWSQSLTLDGGSVQKSGLARAQAELSPMVDAVEEFKVITNNYAAEYGRTAAGVFTAVTKSGTNQFHGTLFHFFRNDAMDARNFFAIRKAPLRYNQFGGTVGGPIRKDKTHFFAALETTKTTRGSTSILTVPTAAQKQGIFTGLTDAQGRALPVYNPFTTRPNPANATLRTRDPFPNNVIPVSLFDPVAVNVVKFYPDPNVAGNLAGANNFNTNIPAYRTQYHGTLRVDHVLTSKDKIFGRYVAQQNATPATGAYAEAAANPARDVANLAHTYLGSWVRTMTPTLLNDFKFGGTNQNRDISHPSMGGNWPSKLGAKGAGEQVFPAYRPAGTAVIGTTTAPFRLQTNPYWQVIDTMSWFRGAHSVKFGYEYRSNVTTDEFDVRPSGDFTFAQQATGLQNVTQSGSGFAAMLLGFATRAEVQDAINFRFQNYYMGWFVQDDWKLTPRLTLNIGVRYDFENGRISKDDTQNAFDMRAIHPTARVPGVMRFAGVDGEPRRVFDTDYNNVAPRFGFAWRPFGGDKTVVRGGMGVFFGNPDDQGFSNTAVLGYSTTALLISPDNNQTAAMLLKQGFTGITAPTAASRNAAYGVNGPVDFYQRERATPYSMQYNFGVQHEVRQVLLSGQYVASLGRKLTAGSMSLNQVRPELVGGAGSIQSRRPFPQFTEVLLDSPNLGHSSYHAFLARVEKRYQNGLQFLFNYTFSKFIDNVDALSDFNGTPGAGYQDFYNRGLDKSLSGLDIKHLATFNAVYDLPFLKKTLLGGWQLSVLGTLAGGPVYGVTTQQNTCECFSAGPQRVNLLRDPALPAGERTVQRWFDINAFAQPERFRFGNAARAVGRAPGKVNFDLGIMKNFAIGERIRVQFRAEMFNAFNHANFGIPGTAFGGPNFGAINSAEDGRINQLGLKIYF
jgi:hypothetical protein